MLSVCKTYITCVYDIGVKHMQNMCEDMQGVTSDMTLFSYMGLTWINEWSTYQRVPYQIV